MYNVSEFQGMLPTAEESVGRLLVEAVAHSDGECCGVPPDQPIVARESAAHKVPQFSEIPNGS